MAKILIGSYLGFLPIWCHKNKVGKYFLQLFYVKPFSFFASFVLTFDDCLAFQFLSFNKIRRVTLPSLFLSGLTDDLVPPSMMECLYECCASSLKQKYAFPHGTHNETWRCQGYFHAWMSFVMDVRKSDANLADQTTTRAQPILHSVIETV